jgi:uncharacterized protein YciI
MAEYVIISNLIVSQEAASGYRSDHLNYLRTLKKSGKLVAAGGFADAKGGMYIINVDSDAEAEQIARNDPYHINRARSFEVRKWNKVDILPAD